MRVLDVIVSLPYDFICPSQVETEIAAGVEMCYPVSFPPWIKVSLLKNSLSALSLANLDAGEAAVIELALEQGIELVCLDELKGRRAALAAGLRVIGSLGLIGKAKTIGLISNVRPLVERAEISGIYYDRKLVERFLGEMGE